MFGLIAAATLMSVPVSENGMASRIESSVGDEVLESGLVGVWYEALVSPEGTIEDCRVRASIGDAEGARHVCEKVIGRHAKPARDADGKATYGLLRGSLNFATNYKRIPPEAVQADLTLFVAAPFGKPERVDLTVAVDEEGAIRACDAGASVGKLATTACAQVQDLEMPVRKARDGVAVSYLQAMTVEFREDDG